MLKKPAARRNRLAKEKSPYLLQHADNPVDWYPWGDVAFERARREEKPVFLSIGYSTCHWCHVMAHESFENPEIAKILNDHFVSIKVDREERPDVDQVYMTATQMMTGSGGWPLSVWTTPDRKPFFAGTYFPPDDRFGRTGFPTILRKIAELWKENRASLVGEAEQAARMLEGAGEIPKGDLDPKILQEGFEGFRSQFDAGHGGFGGAPKFPRSVVLEFLLRHHRRAANAEALEMAVKTLQAMRSGGIFDQLGGGFHRYSTDERWLVPHFEKMLYDNALLARAYAQAWQLTGREEFARTARETLDYVLRDLTSDDGAFLSAEDADSLVPEAGRKAEGYFYLWNCEQVKAAVPGRDGDLLCRAFGVIQGGNFESPHEGDPAGMSVLRLDADDAALAKEFGPAPEEVRRIVERGRAKLFEARKSRPRPHRDDKVLADWNGLAIGSMAFCGTALGEPRYIDAAERAARVLVGKLRREDGRWLHAPGIGGLLDDYASMAEGFFFLHQATFKIEYAEIAIRTAELMIEEFGDPAGGFFQTGKSGEKLIARLKETYDGAMPSGNSVATLALLRLAHLASRDDFRKKAEETLRLLAGAFARNPTAYPYHLCALDALVGPAVEVVIAGDAPEMLREVRRRFLPNAVVCVAGDERTAKALPIAANRPMIDGKPAAYVCTNGTCKLPARSADDLAKQLGQ